MRKKTLLLRCFVNSFLVKIELIWPDKSKVKIIANYATDNIFLKYIFLKT